MNRLDEEFVKNMLQVEKDYQSLSRHFKIRVEQWTKKLCEPTSNHQWKKNRNNYARLLLAMVRAAKLEEPFHRVPPTTALPNLPPHLLAPLKDDRRQLPDDSLPSLDSDEQRHQQAQRPADLGERILLFLEKHEGKLRDDPEYGKLVQSLKRGQLGEQLDPFRQLERLERDNAALLKETNQTLEAARRFAGK